MPFPASDLPWRSLLNLQCLDYRNNICEISKSKGLAYIFSLPNIIINEYPYKNEEKLTISLHGLKPGPKWMADEKP